MLYTSIGCVSGVISLTSMGTASEGRGGANKSYVIIVTIRAQRSVSSMAAVGLHRKRKKQYVTNINLDTGRWWGSSAFITHFKELHMLQPHM